MPEPRKTSLRKLIMQFWMVVDPPRRLLEDPEWNKKRHQVEHRFQSDLGQFVGRVNTFAQQGEFENSALRLRALRGSGVAMIKVSILTNFVFGFLAFLVSLSLHFVATDADARTSTPAGDVISFFMLIVVLATLTFEIAAVIWLFRNSRTLPLANA